MSGTVRGTPVRGLVWVDIDELGGRSIGDPVALTIRGFELTGIYALDDDGVPGIAVDTETIPDELCVPKVKA